MIRNRPLPLAARPNLGAHPPPLIGESYDVVYSCNFAVVGLSLLTSLVSVCAAADWPPITPEEQALKDVQEQPGAHAVILERQEIADDLNNYHSTYKRIKVLTEAGRKEADVELPYNRNGFSISEISGRTVHPDGTVTPFAGKP